MLKHALRAILCRLGWHEWHDYRQIGGGKKTRCVHCYDLKHKSDRE